MPNTSGLVGARLGPYKILSALGAGGMGEVYLALVPEAVSNELPLTAVQHWNRPAR